MQSQTHHVQPLLRTGMRCITVRWRTSRNEMDSSHAALFQRFLRQTQVSVVDRVEGSAEYTDGRDVYRAHSLQCQPAHVRQHLRQIGDETGTCCAVNHTVVIR